MNAHRAQPAQSPPAAEGHTSPAPSAVTGTNNDQVSYHVGLGFSSPPKNGLSPARVVGLIPFPLRSSGRRASRPGVGLGLFGSLRKNADPPIHFAPTPLPPFRVGPLGPGPQERPCRAAVARSTAKTRPRRRFNSWAPAHSTAASSRPPTGPPPPPPPNLKSPMPTAASDSAYPGPASGLGAASSGCCCWPPRRGLLQCTGLRVDR